MYRIPPQEPSIEELKEQLAASQARNKDLETRNAELERQLAASQASKIGLKEFLKREELTNRRLTSYNTRLRREIKSVTAQPLPTSRNWPHGTEPFEEMVQKITSEKYRRLIDEMSELAPSVATSEEQKPANNNQLSFNSELLTGMLDAFPELSTLMDNVQQEIVRTSSLPSETEQPLASIFIKEKESSVPLTTNEAARSSQIERLANSIKSSTSSKYVSQPTQYFENATPTLVNLAPSEVETVLQPTCETLSFNHLTYNPPGNPPNISETFADRSDEYYYPYP